MRREDFFEKIELLVKMTGAKMANGENLIAELDEIKDELSVIKAEKKALKAEMNEDRYFDAAAEIVDRNLVIGLKKQINRIKEEIEATNNILNESIKAEEQLNVELFSVENALNNDNNYINSLEQRINKLSKSGESEDFNHYNDSLSIAKENYKEEKDKVNELNKQYKEVLETIDQKTTLVESLKEKLEDLKHKLKDINSSLENKDAYVNVDLKALDDSKIAIFDEKIDTLEEKKLKIINDPVYMANEIKESLSDDDVIGAMKKTKELIKVVSKLPFMDEDDNDKLIELKASLVSEKDEFVKYIENKRYDEINTEVLSDRVVYLNNVISTINEEIDLICKKIARVDNGGSNMATLLKKATNDKEAIETDITLYENILSTEEHMPIRRRNAITTILTKKNDQLKAINKIIEAYKTEEFQYLEEIYNLENSDLALLKAKIQVIEDEKESINKVISNLKSKNKDVLAEESDKEVLKEFDEKIKAIDTRLEFSESLSSIKNDIEQYFGEQADLNEVVLDTIEEKKEPVEEDNKEANEIVFKSIDDILTANDDLVKEETITKEEETPELEFVDFDDDKFLEIPESNVVKLDDILESTSNFEPLYDNIEEVKPLFEKEPTDYQFESVTSFNLPQFEFPNNLEEDPELLEVIEVTPIIVEDKNGEGE